MIVFFIILSASCMEVSYMLFSFSDGNHQVMSPVLSVTYISSEHLNDTFQYNITVLFNTEQFDEDAEITCVGWDLGTNSWSAPGCARSTDQKHDRDVVVCECDQYRHFAILVTTTPAVSS